MTIVSTSIHTDEKTTIHHKIYTKEGRNGPWATIDIDYEANIFFDDPRLLDDLIREATKARDELARLQERREDAT